MYITASSKIAELCAVTAYNGFDLQTDESHPGPCTMLLEKQNRVTFHLKMQNFPEKFIF